MPTIPLMISLSPIHPDERIESLVPGNSALSTNHSRNNVVAFHKPAQLTDTARAFATTYEVVTAHKLHRRDSSSKIGLFGGLAILFLVLGGMSYVWHSRRQRHRRRRHPGKRSRSDKRSGRSTYSTQVDAFSYQESRGSNRKKHTRSSRHRDKKQHRNGSNSVPCPTRPEMAYIRPVCCEYKMMTPQDNCEECPVHHCPTHLCPGAF